MRYLVISALALGLAGCGDDDADVTASTCAAVGKKLVGAACADLDPTDKYVVARSTTYTICWTYSSSTFASLGLVLTHATNATALPAAACPATTGAGAMDLLGTCNTNDEPAEPVFSVFEATTSTEVTNCRAGVASGSGNDAKVTVAGQDCITSNVWKTDCADTGATVCSTTAGDTLNTCVTPS